METVPRRKPHASQNRAAETDRAPSMQPTLPETVISLRRVRDRPLQPLERALSRLRKSLRSPNVPDDVISKLSQLRSEYLNAATELEAIARSCRMAERNLHRQIMALFEQMEGKLEVSGVEATALASRPFHQAASRSLSSSSWLPSSALWTPDVAARILGPFELTVDGRRISRWNSLKARALFQYLLISEGRPVRRELLMELQWPGHTHNSARNNLNVAPSTLRDTLQGPNQSAHPILYQGGCYSLNPELAWWIDRSEFRSVLSEAQIAARSGELRQAVDAHQPAVPPYRGPPFRDAFGGWFPLRPQNLTAM